MKATKSNITRALPLHTELEACDNSGAKIIYIISVKGHKTAKGKRQAAGVGDFITAVVKTGNTEMRKQKVNAIIVRQKKEYRRHDGTRIKFENNAAVVLKDEKGNPKGTLIKGPVAKEAAEKWTGIGKIASIIV
ncbi:MAG: 50S ribosomal protein L14 [Nanoarchaeota archaeon]|jgi:large subunit ribosomal protein L14|nr:50S ribosomal protein L14 [Nanoarchaeota archaeon]|tara:strand:- start:27184 stop:27585 length:402 start_codon:yes stop_codon:yes gene_type:complete